MRASTSAYRTNLGAAIVVAAMFAAGCQIIDSVAPRATTMNITAGDYDNIATLLNIVRSSRSEPLVFVALTGVTGHDTLGATLAIPTFLLGPDKTPTQRLFILGPNSISGIGSNDFNVNVIDDPGSYASLLTPVSPATIGFFINQGYSPALMFYLFVDHIRIETGPGTGVFTPYANTPWDTSDTSSFGPFASKILTALENGLTIQVDRSFIPSQRITPAHRICFDTSVARNPRERHAPDCYASSREWVPSRNLDRQSADKFLSHRSTAAVATNTSPGAARSSVTEPRDSRGSGTRKSAVASDSDQIPFEPYWEFQWDGRKVQLFTRSTYGVYGYLGRLVLASPNMKLQVERDPKTDVLISVTHDQAGCFVSVDYEGEAWCVPSEAIYTKRIFQLLHQLIKLLTTPSNQPSTTTVRATPQ